MNKILIFLILILSLIQIVHAQSITLPALPVIISTALVDSINPCAIGVLILLMGTLLTLSKDKRKMLITGLIYILAVFITYFLAGIGLLLFIQRFNLAEIIGVIVGIIIIILGLIEIKDFWWYGKGISLAISYKRSKQIEKMMKKITIPGSIVLGIFVAAVELPCTGGPYLAITALFAKVGLTGKIFAYLVLYNFIYVLPLIVMLFLVYFGISIKSLEKWKQKNKKWMRLITGVVLISLGIILILFAANFISFSLIY